MGRVVAAGGHVVLVDDADIPEVSKYRWCLNKGYAQTNLYDRTPATTIWMHRFLLSPARGAYVDHINGNKLDNRRENLRVVTPGENALNHKPYKSARHGVSGVYQSPENGRWSAYIHRNHKRFHLGVFSTKEEAIAARRAGEALVFGDMKRRHSISQLELKEA